MISSFCQDGGCVNVSHDAVDQLIAVRDEDGNEAYFHYHEWEDFLKGVKNGEFEIDKIPQGGNGD